jgi:hypothetical protein
MALHCCSKLSSITRVDALRFFLFLPAGDREGVELFPKLSSPKLRWSQTERHILCGCEGIDDVELHVKLFGRRLRSSLREDPTCGPADRCACRWVIYLRVFLDVGFHRN